MEQDMDIPVELQRKTLLKSPCSIFSSFFFRFDGKKMFVVVGGNKLSSEILDLETMTWRDGPTAGGWYSNNVAAQFGDTFVVVGGDVTDNIYEFDAENEAWIERHEKLSTERRDTTAVFVKDNVVNC